MADVVAPESPARAAHLGERVLPAHPRPPGRPARRPPSRGCPAARRRRAPRGCARAAGRRRRGRPPAGAVPLIRRATRRCGGRAGGMPVAARGPSTCSRHDRSQGHQLVGAGRRGRPRLPPRPGRSRDLGEVDAEGAAEAATDVGLLSSRHSSSPATAPSTLPAGLSRSRRIAQHVAGVVVGHRCPGAPAPSSQALAGDELRQLDGPLAIGSRRLLLAACRRRAPGSPWHTIAAHDPEGTTTGSSPANARSARRATRRASSGWPDDQPGLPAAGLAPGDDDLDPGPREHGARRLQTDGAATSARHVRMSMALIDGSYPRSSS